jgi:putative ABC transport system permease protein
MTLSDVIKKLARHNIKRYMLFCVSVLFAVSMLGAFGVLLFSNTVTDVLVAGGSTHTFALGMYAFTILGMMIFLVYANSIYMKYKMEEIGVFLSLGLKQKTVLNMLKREFCLLFCISALIGLVLSVPIAFLSWSFLTFFISTAETAFSIGWMGIFVDAVFTVFVWGLLMLQNSITLKRIDIIRILKISSENENQRFANVTLGLIGLIGIPIGFLFFNICESRSDFWGQNSMLFLGLSLLCLYLLTSEITAIGDFFKKHFQNIYRKNILFFNLVRQKGRQYTLSLFVSTILIAVGIFGIGFMGAIFLESYYQIKEDPYDYSLLTGFEQKEINQSEIEQLADKYEVNIDKMNILDLLLIGRDYQYDDHTSEWSGEFVTSASSYNLLTKENTFVPQGSCVFYVNAEDDPALQTISKHKALFYNPTLHQEFTMPVIDQVVGAGLLNKCGEISDMFILNDIDFDQLKESVESRYQLKYYLFNAPSATRSKAFHDALLQKVVEASDGKILDNFFDSPVRELMIAEGKKIPEKDYYMNYNGNELYAARWWSMYPFAKESALSSQLETGAIYFLIMFFIAIIAFVSAVMVIGLKILGTIWQDEESYKKAVCLGLKEKSLSKLIAKQISFIYYYPTFLGCVIGVVMINQIILASASTHSGEVTLIAVILALMIVVIQVIIYYLLKKNIIKRFRTNLIAK